MMNPDAKKMWVDALRSGEYKQGFGQLRNEANSFCCLGVLCNIHAQEFPDVAKGESTSARYLGHNLKLPHDVMQWAGLKSPAGDRVMIGKSFVALATHNDYKKSFKQIADAIEAEL